MDPISLTLGVVGLGMSLFGGMGQASSAHEKAGLEQQKAGLSAENAGYEGQQNEIRRSSMEMANRRSQLENFRTTQRQRAMAVQAGVNQGAQQGTGLAGGLAEVTSEGNYGLAGLQSSLTFGRGMFDLDSKISANRIQMARLGGQEAQTDATSATYGGIASMGGSLMKFGPTVGNIFKGGGTSGGGFNFMFGGGSPSGYGTGG